MSLYRKKPVVVEARQLTLDADPAKLARWCRGQVIWGITSRYIEIPTLEGMMHASIGDWIIKGVRGEFYPCKPDIFEATYEPAGDTT